MSREEQERQIWVRDWSIGKITQAIKTVASYQKAAEAIFMAEDWLVANKPASEFLVVLGKIYLQNGQIEKAEAAAHEAEKINPRDMAVRSLLAQCQRARQG